MQKKTTRRLAAAAGIAGVTAVALSTMGAGAAAAGPLPGGQVTQTLLDGTKVTVTLKNEFANINPSTVALPTSRNVWLSGQVLVDVQGGAEGGNIEAGYIVGCQLNFGAEAGGNVGIAPSPGSDPSGGIAPGGTDSEGNVYPGGVPGSTGSDPSLGQSADLGGGFTLQPGEAKYWALFREDDENVGIDFEGAKGGVAYSQETFAVDGCAGFAEAKAYVKVTVETPSVTGIVTLYGKPFSIG
ncbi:MspA family porin [Williamsia sp. 1135]|uniref:MspA family porin n=1 Tax=Williamsia sp. 1135 TaxID=1889262 RepID=UPI000A0F6D14|nr:MspA family porin [Williamsia sp. 1135]ORM30227.1 hypothetical protein BFL43_19490 [Williamsia sp. 1135]